MSDMTKAAGEAGADMIADLVNQIIVAVTPVESVLTTIINCYKGKGDALERVNYRGLKSTDHQLKSYGSDSSSFLINILLLSQILVLLPNFI